MQSQSLTPFPFWEDLRRYKGYFLGRDLIAAISVALMALPQAMAYAFVAHLPPSVGVFAAIFGTIFTAAFGASRYLISGPTTAVALLIESGVSETIATHYPYLVGPAREEMALMIVMQLVLLVGIFQVLAGLFRLGRVTQFTSRSVMLGYMLGVAIAIIISQLFPFLGIADLSRGRSFYQKGWYLLVHLKEVHYPTLLMGIGCLVLIWLFYRLSRKIPGAVIVFIAAALIAWLFHLSPVEKQGLLDVTSGQKVEKITLLEDIGQTQTGFPKIALPHMQLVTVTTLVPIAFAIALVSILEATSIGRLFTRSKEPYYKDNQEILGLGISNFLTSFVGALPSSGSFSRSSLNRALRSKTRFSAIFSGIVLLLIVILFGSLVGKIPIAALSALMLFTAYTMINLRDLSICIRATWSDAVVILITFLASLIFTLDVTLFIGILVSVALYLNRAATPLIVEYAFNNIGKLRPLEPEDTRPDERIAILQAEGELFFGSADALQTKLRRECEDENVQVVILQLFNVRTVDASTCLALQKVVRYLKSAGRVLMISGLVESVHKVIVDSTLAAEVGEGHLFLADDQNPSESTREAYAAAKEALSLDRV